MLATAKAYAQRPELIVQTGHYDRVNSVAFSPDGKILASNSADGTIRLWEVGTGHELRTLKELGPTGDAAFSPDGKILANANSNFEIVLWQTATGKELHRLKGHINYIKSLAFSPDGKILASGSDDYKIKLWNLSTGQELRTLTGHTFGVYSVAFSPDGKILASSSRDGTIKLWEVSNGQKLYTLKSDIEGSRYSMVFDCVAFSPDGRFLAGGNERGTIKLWEAATGKELYTFAGDNKNFYNINSIAFSPNGNVIASGGNDKMVHLWEVGTGRELRRFTGHVDDINAVAFSPDGTTLASGSRDATIKFWEVGTGQELRAIAGYSNPVYSVAFRPDGQMLAIGSSDTTIKLLELNTGQKIRLLTGHSSYVTFVAFSPDGKILASGSKDKQIKLWQISTGRELRTLTGHYEEVNCVAFSPDGKILASSSHDQTIKLWEIDTGEELYTLTGDSSIVHSVAFSPDGKFLAGGIGGGKIRIWEVDSGREFRTLPGHSDYETSYTRTVAFSPDGKILASGSRDGEIKFWQVGGSRRDKELRTLTGHSFDVTFVAFSPDGKVLASGSVDKMVKFWDVDTGKELLTLAGHNDYISAVAFSPDGKILASGSNDTTIKLWDVASGKEIASLIVLGEKVWVVVTPDGRFDGSSEGMKRMHYVQDNKSIPLEAFFDQFYTPKLLARALSGEVKTAEPPKVDLSKGIKFPPLVKIMVPKTGEAFTTEALNLTVEATDQGGGVNEIRLYQNEKLVSEEQRNMRPVAKPGDKITKTFPVTLVRGMNEFKAIAFNLDHTESYPEAIRLELKAVEPEACLYLLAIGINSYKNASYNLNYGKPDAVAFVQSAEKRGQGIFKQIFKHALYDEQATREGIGAAFNTIIKAAKPQDVFMFFYAGHGVMSEGNSQTPAEYYLAPHEVTKLSDDELLAAQGLSAKQLKEYCVKIEAQKQLIVLDACQAGGAVETFARRGAAEEKAMAQLARSTGVTILAASDTKQYATEFSQLGHGVFTYALLKGLNGEADGGMAPDGKITVKELEAYLNDKVPELTKKYRGSAQYPNSYARGQDFPLGVLR